MKIKKLVLLGMLAIVCVVNMSEAAKMTAVQYTKLNKEVNDILEKIDKEYIVNKSLDHKLFIGLTEKARVLIKQALDSKIPRFVGGARSMDTKLNELIQEIKEKQVDSQLKKEKLSVEKEKLSVEKEKLSVEKEKKKLKKLEKKLKQEKDHKKKILSPPTTLLTPPTTLLNPLSPSSEISGENEQFVPFSQLQSKLLPTKKEFANARLAILALLNNEGALYPKNDSPNPEDEEKRQEMKQSLDKVIRFNKKSDYSLFKDLVKGLGITSKSNTDKRVIIKFFKELNNQLKAVVEEGEFENNDENQQKYLDAYNKYAKELLEINGPEGNVVDEVGGLGSFDF